MGFIRENGIVIGAILVVALIVAVWVERGRLCSASTVAATAEAVEPIERHENEIGLNPLRAPALLDSLRRFKF